MSKPYDAQWRRKLEPKSIQELITSFARHPTHDYQTKTCQIKEGVLYSADTPIGSYREERQPPYLIRRLRPGTRGTAQTTYRHTMLLGETLRENNKVFKYIEEIYQGD